MHFDSKVILEGERGNSKHKSEHESKSHHAYSVQIAVDEFAMLTELSKYKSFSRALLFLGPVQRVTLRISKGIRGSEQSRCEAVRVTLFITLSRFRLPTSRTGAFLASPLKSDTHSLPNQRLPSPKGSQASENVQSTEAPGKLSLKLLGRSFLQRISSYEAQIPVNGPCKAACHTVCQHVLCSLELRGCVSCPLDHTKIELLGA